MKFLDRDPSKGQDGTPNRVKARRYGRNALAAVWSAGLVGGIGGAVIADRLTSERAVPSSNKIELVVDSGYTNTGQDGSVITDSRIVTLQGNGKGELVAKNQTGNPIELDLHIPVEK